MEGDDSPAGPEALFAGRPHALAIWRSVRDAVERLGPVDCRVSRSQLAWRRRRGFAYLWLPGRWLRNPTAEVVLTIALERHDDSPRFKEVAHPARSIWVHHLEMRAPGDCDEEVAAWLREAYDWAG